MRSQAGVDLTEYCYQVRQYPAWHRHVTLAMIALAFLAVTRAHLPDLQDGLGGGRGDGAGRAGRALRRRAASAAGPPDLAPTVDPVFTLAWSVWRRRHQATARRSHYQQQRRKLRL
jgi:hypothetical protein